MKRTLLLFAALLSLSTGVFAERATLDPAKGWTTTLTALPEDVSQYFFAIYDHDTEKAMVLAAGNHQGADNKTMWYQTDVDPEKNKDALWIFDGFDNSNYSGATGNNVTRLIITGVSNMDYCLQSYDGSYYRYRTGDNGEGWTDRAYVIPSYGEISAGCWSLKNNKAGDNTDCYIGHWETDDEVAGNITNKDPEHPDREHPERTGHFDFYAITRGQYVAVAEDIYRATEANPIDISYVITNADATRKNNFHAAQPVGWKLSQDDAFECEFANYLPSKVGDSYFNKWQGSGNLTDRSMSQTVTGLPSGRYRLSVITHSSVIAAGANLFANSDKTALNTVTESNVVSVTTTVTDGHLTFGVELKGYQSNNCKFDHFTLEYLGWSFPVAFGVSGFGTFACPQKLALPDDETVKAYTATVSGSTVTFHKLTGCIPANTGVLVSGEANTTVDLYVTDKNAEVVDNDFVKGTGEKFSGTDDKYYLAVKKSAEQLTFAKFEPSEVAIAINKAYLPINKNAFDSKGRFTILFEDDDPMAINAIEAADTKAEGLKDGKYFVGNRIILVKNGVKFSANGQLLK